MNPAPRRSLPVFPLEQVTFPGATKALHIFESRYRTLAGDLSQLANPRLALVPILKGSEVGGGDQRADVGVMARVVRGEELPDGRWGLVVIARQRIRVIEWLPDNPYPCAEVIDWPDDPAGDLGTAVGLLRDAFHSLAEVVQSLRPGANPLADWVEPSDPSETIWRMIDRSQLSDLDNLDLFRCGGALQRAERARELIDDRRDLLDALAGRDR